MKKRLTSIVLLVLLLAMTNVYVFADEGLGNFKWDNQPMKFSDVPENAWYYKAVSETSATKIINGVGDGKFMPNSNLTYADALTLAAKVHAIYYDEMDELTKYQNKKKSGHWALGTLEYCAKKKLQTVAESGLDKKIDRSTMVSFFYSAVPKSVFTAINDEKDMPGTKYYDAQKTLFKAGVFVGDSDGLRLSDYITRAEAAAIIHRVAKPEERVKVEPRKEHPYDPAVPTEQFSVNEVQTDKPYKRIPRTRWTFDPTGGVVVKSEDRYIDTKYGSHDYGAGNQALYNKLLTVLDEAFEAACEEELCKNYRMPMLEALTKPEDKKTIFIKEQLNITEQNQIANVRLTENIVSNMQSYLYDTYAKPNGAGSNKGGGDDNVYTYLFNGGYLDCDGLGSLNMMCWDYLGFSTRMITSARAVHACAELYINGCWVMLEQQTGKLVKCTHDQFMELLSGVKNDAYTTSSSVEPFVKIASDYAASGVKQSNYPSDLEIRYSEGPTHAPQSWHVSLMN